MENYGVHSFKDSQPIRMALQAVLESILGKSGFAALHYHLRRFLDKDPLGAFYNRPRDFYDALVSIFGENGAAATFKIICGKLIVLSGFEHLTPDEIYGLLLRDEASVKRILCQMLKEIAGKRGEIS